MPATHLEARSAELRPSVASARPLPADHDLPFDLSIIIVALNGWPYLKRCLQRLPDAAAGLRHEVIVVDNGSSDGTPEYLRQRYPEIALIALEGNTGFAAANNRGLMASRGRHILLLNSDTEAGPGSLAELVGFLDEHADAAVAAPRLLNADGSDQGTARRFTAPVDALLGRTSVITRWFPNHPHARHALLSRQVTDDQPFEVDQVSGACLLARRRAVLHVGLLDERFFFYWEDGDWCRRFKASGWQVWCVPAARVVHHEHGSSGGRPNRLVVEFHRSVYRYYCKHHARSPLHPMRPVAAIGLSARAGVLIARNLLRRTPLVLGGR